MCGRTSCGVFAASSLLRTSYNFVANTSFCLPSQHDLGLPCGGVAEWIATKRIRKVRCCPTVREDHAELVATNGQVLDAGRARVVLVVVILHLIEYRVACPNRVGELDELRLDGFWLVVCASCKAAPAWCADVDAVQRSTLS